MEVAGGHHLAIGHNDRVVHDRTEFGLEDAPGEGEHVPDGAVHLRSAAQAVGILDGVRAVTVAGHQL